MTTKGPELRESRPGDWKQLSRCTLDDRFRLPGCQGVHLLTTADARQIEGRYYVAVAPSARDPQNLADELFGAVRWLPWDTRVQLV